MSASSPTILFSGGGTAGHLMPGLAVADVLRAHRASPPLGQGAGVADGRATHQPGFRIVFAGSGQPWERRWVEARGFEYRGIGGAPLGWSPRGFARFVLGNVRAYRAARELLDELRPAVAVGLGGYASAAVARAAARCKIPLVLLEQNAVPGRATRWLACRAQVVCTSFDETRRHLPRAANVRFTGNPVRPEIAALGNEIPSSPNLPRPTHSARLSTLLVLGGSQGARGVNDAVVEALAQLTSWSERWRIVHQAGRAQEAEVRAAYRELPFEVDVAGFIDDIRGCYAAADLVVCRAGGTTVAEIACAGLPAVLIPFPHAARDHQRRNAETFARAGAAEVVPQRAGRGEASATAAALARLLRRLLDDAPRRRSLAEAARRLARPRAAWEVADVIGSLSSGPATLGSSARASRSSAGRSASAAA